jgi:type III restriction enzyme
MKNTLEKIVDAQNYDDLGAWQLPNLSSFSDTKNLFEYQNKALRNITKVLSTYFGVYNQSQKDTESRKVLESKKSLFALYQESGLDSKRYAVTKYAKNGDRQIEKVNPRFTLFQNHFEALGYEYDKHIGGMNFMNRACFWMATGSGKSFVLIKTIELLDYLQSQDLIPKKEIMLLLPREDLVKQFTREITEFNRGRERQIELINLKNYEDQKHGFDFDTKIKVYYYRSDLIRDDRKETQLDYKTYENNGNWYVFLDEAHRGGKEDSLMQDYVSILSKNGFLFNFSATFTDSIDYLTTCYNFNLEKFILEGYGKNLYLSNSYFDFSKNKDDFSEREKQKQVLKSLLVFTLVKKVKKENCYHHPLLITLVNSINTEDADLLLFFQKLEEIASGKIDIELFQETKAELVNEFRNYTSYQFGSEELKFDLNLLEVLTQKNIFECVFNATNYGKIEILEGIKGKELVLKLETSEKPFALIKIGDAGKFQKDQLGSNYTIIKSFDSKKYFENINKSEDINLLLGSRSFYEGWDSNRPNVINMINIGKSDAKKFVLQGIGRGIRIEPHKGERKRLPATHLDKNTLLETLFVFATDKNAVKAIVETMENEKNKQESEISLYQNQNKPFDLLLPVYKDEESKVKIAKFNIAQTSLDIFNDYINSFDIGTLVTKTSIPKIKLNNLLSKINNKDFFQINSENQYSDMNQLLYKIINHISIKNKIVGGLTELSDEIIHFKHIKVDLNNEEKILLQEKIDRVNNFVDVDEKSIDELFDNGKITREQYKEQLKNLGNSKAEESFKDLKITKIAEHYYLPLIYSEKEKVEYIKHIIDVKSEVDFIKKLEKKIKKDNLNTRWMFSKIDQTLDKFNIPYYDSTENKFAKFFPDFIFWIKKDNQYKIVFVDPKGTSHSKYQNKIDGFEKLFMENDKLKIFDYKHFKVTFELKMVTDDLNKVAEKYKEYWINENNFEFLTL